MSDCEIAWKRSVLLCPKCYHSRLIRGKKVFKVYQEFDVCSRMCVWMCTLIADTFNKTVRDVPCYLLNIILAKATGNRGVQLGMCCVTLLYTRYCRIYLFCIKEYVISDIIDTTLYFTISGTLKIRKICFVLVLMERD